MAFLKKNRRRITILLVELLVFLLVYLGIRAWMQRDMVEGQAPALPSVTLQGEAFSLESYQGNPVLVHFWASWCGPCKMMAPQFALAANRLEPNIRLAKVNTEDQPDLGARYGIRSIPTMALFRSGRELARHSGAIGADEIVRWALSELNKGKSS